MAEVRCVHCGETREGAGRVLPGELGDEIGSSICAECWREWLQMQIRVINHYGLQPAIKADRERLYEFIRMHLLAPAPEEQERA